MATYYLNADTGVDSGAGGSGAPWLTIVYAIANSTTGDTLYCQNSTATYDFRAATISNRTIEGESRDGVIFDGASGNNTWAIATTGTVVVKNISVKNVISTSAPIIGYNHNIGGILTIDNCNFYDCTAYSTADEKGIVGGNSWAQGMCTLTITNCIFNDIDLTGSNYPAYFCLRGATVGSVCNFYNNVFYIKTTPSVTADAVFQSYNDGTNITWNIKNSILRNLTPSLKMTGSYVTASTLTLTNCAIYGFSTTGNNQVNTVTADPRFVDAVNGDFRLSPTSPCLDTGVAL